MAVGDATLPLSICDLERTREPLERATMLPGAAFTDPPRARASAMLSASIGRGSIFSASASSRIAFS